jgi:hypothetical protein
MMGYVEAEDEEFWRAKGKTSRSSRIGCLLLAITTVAVCAVLGWYIVFAVA